MRDNIELISLDLMFLALQVRLERLFEAFKVDLRLHNGFSHLLRRHHRFIRVLEWSIFEHNTTIQAHGFSILGHVDTFHRLVSLIEVDLSEALVDHLARLRLQIHHTRLLGRSVLHVLQSACL